MMREEKENEKGKKLRYTAIAVILIAILAFLSIYTYVSNSVSSALTASLETFSFESAIATPTVEGAELNITFILTNPTEFPIIIDTIIISFSIDNVDIRGVNINPNETVLAGKHNYFYFYNRVIKENVLNSLQNETYKLSVTEGSWIRGSASYLFFQTHITKPIAFSTIVRNP
ncbi:hypothetical protein KAU87_00680 [Candidatus Bathyarchaeota archaeon]|nr:hypothetical protein [Candidatus Bathyarchaeota archaeon]